MPASYLGVDYNEVLTRVLANYRSTYVALPGEPVKEPAPTASGSAPTDWVALRVMRSESSHWNTEAAQRRKVRVAAYLALQPGRGEMADRIDTIAADLEDAFSIARNSGSNAFDGSFAYVGESVPPPNLNPSHQWDWHALMFEGDFLGAPS